MGKGATPCACSRDCCFRPGKYRKGGRFKTHVDSKFLRNYNERSMFTLNANLNGDFMGGATRFFDVPDRSNEVTSITPVGGQVPLFRQPPGAYLPHDGEEVESGVKCLLGSGMIYRRVES